MHILKKTLSGALVFALAAMPALPAAAADSGKEEVVYANLDAAGDLEAAYIVNSFGPGSITDHGDYSKVTMLNTDDAIDQEGDAVTFTSDASRVYYEGTLADPALPWQIDLSYRLDGKTVTPEKLAGASGELEIRFCVTKNNACSGSFYDDYALQASVTLDSDRCRNIQAPDATIAGVGGDKQLTFTILPGEGIDTTIRADVTDFEMDAVSINGVRLNLGADVDTDEMEAQVAALVDATVRLDDGAVALADGARSLESGAFTLKNGSGSLTSGIAALDGGVQTLQNGLSQMQQGLDALDARSGELANGSAAFASALTQVQAAVDGVALTTEDLAALSAASTNIKAAIDQLAGVASGLGAGGQTAVGDVGTLMAQNSQAAAAIGAQTAQLQDLAGSLAAVSGMEAQAAELQASIAQLAQISTLLESNNAALSAVQNTASAGGEVSALTGSLSALQAQYAAFDTQIQNMVAGLQGMSGNLSALQAALAELNEQYAAIDGGINSYTSGVSQISGGYASIMQGVADLASASQELLAGSGSLDDGSARLYDGIVSLSGGAQTLAQGTSSFRSETAGIDGLLDEKLSPLTKILDARDAPVVSFASEKNENVASVQFVMQTEAITLPAVEEEDEESEAPQRFWDKLRALFQ